MQGNTLTDPKFKEGDTLKTFDYVVANLPFSDKRLEAGRGPVRVGTSIGDITAGLFATVCVDSG